MIKGTVITAWKAISEPYINSEIEQVNRPKFYEDYPKSAFDDITASYELITNPNALVINFICTEEDFSELQDDPRYTVLIAEEV